MRTLRFGCLISVLGLVASLSACGSDARSGGSSGDMEPTDAPIQGLSNDPVGNSLVDLITADAVPPEELEEDANGALVELTRIEVVLYPETTTRAANNLLDEIGAEVVGAMGGYPAVVLAIPNPGSLQALDALIADLESRPEVEWVIKGIRPEIQILPGNIEASRQDAIDDGKDPKTMEDWKKIANHLAVRGPAAWNAQAAIRDKRRTSVLIRDYFGKGIGDQSEFESIFDVVPAGEYPSSDNNYLIKTEPVPLLCQAPILEDAPRCKIWTRNYGDHGYLILGIHAGRHRFATSLETDFLSGMARNAVKLTAVDYMRYSSREAELFATFLAITEMITNDGLVVESISLGGHCTGDSPTDDCKQLPDLRKRTIERIRRVRASGLEDRLLTVVAAANHRPNEPSDAETYSHWNAASLVPFWFPDGDQVGDDFDISYPALTNTLVVENARIKAGISGGAPYSVECTSLTSNLGGHIAGVGSGFIFKATGPLPDSETKIIQDGGTSSATPQVSGLAAYMGAIDPTLTPQRAIGIIESTARPVPSGVGNSSCIQLTTEPRANVIDAYAAVLALDSANWIDPQDARVRMALLDVASSNDDSPPDGRFDEHDLAVWVGELEYAVRDSEEGVPQLDYGRYDLNGDGYTGGFGLTARFDLDISEVTAPDAFTNDVLSFELDQVLGYSRDPFDENALTDLDIICYYAHTDFYQGDPMERDRLLTDRDDANVHLCDPCGQPGAAAKANGFASKQLPEFCEGVVVTVSPDPVTLAPGQTQRFTATVTGSENTDVAWTATGGTIDDQTGLYTAGDTAGTFSVTATSDADSSVSYGAVVEIGAAPQAPANVSGFYSGTSDYYEDDGLEFVGTDPIGLRIQQSGDQITVTIESACCGIEGTVFNGTYRDGVVTASSPTDNSETGDCSIGTVGDQRIACTLTATATFGESGEVLLSGRLIQNLTRGLYDWFDIEASNGGGSD